MLCFIDPVLVKARIQKMEKSRPSDPRKPLTVFVVDDDEGIRASLTRSLQKRGFPVESFASAQAFLDAYRPDWQGCLILDFGMPGMDGLELQRYLNANQIMLPIIFVTGHGGVPESVQAIKAGAIDFLEKPFRQAVLIERIEAAFDIAAQRQSSLERVRKHQARFDVLTAREKEIVQRMVEQPAETSSKEIAAHLGISPRTVDHHRARILEKLSVRSVAELIALAKERAADE